MLTEFELLALKKRGFMQILDAEAPHLPNSGELIAELRAGVAALTAMLIPPRTRVSASPRPSAPVRTGCGYRADREPLRLPRTRKNRA